MLAQVLDPAGMSVDAHHLALYDVSDWDQEDFDGLLAKNEVAAVQYRGAYSATASPPYAVNDLVSSGGNWFTAKIADPVNPPPHVASWQQTNYWQRDPILVQIGIGAGFVYKGISYAFGDVIRVDTPTADTLVANAEADVVKWRGTWNATRDFAVYEAVGWAFQYWLANPDPAIGHEPGVSGNWTAVSWKVTDIEADFSDHLLSEGGGGGSGGSGGSGGGVINGVVWCDAVHLKYEDGTYRKFYLINDGGSPSTALDTDAIPAP